MSPHPLNQPWSSAPAETPPHPSPLGTPLRPFWVSRASSARRWRHGPGAGTVPAARAVGQGVVHTPRTEGRLFFGCLCFPSSGWGWRLRLRNYQGEGFKTGTVPATPEAATRGQACQPSLCVSHILGGACLLSPQSPHGDLALSCHPVPNRGLTPTPQLVHSWEDLGSQPRCGSEQARGGQKVPGRNAHDPPRPRRVRAEPAAGWVPAMLPSCPTPPRNLAVAQPRATTWPGKAGGQCPLSLPHAPETQVSGRGAGGSGGHSLGLPVFSPW